MFLAIQMLWNQYIFFASYSMFLMINWNYFYAGKLFLINEN